VIGSQALKRAAWLIAPVVVVACSTRPGVSGGPDAVPPPAAASSASTGSPVATPLIPSPAHGTQALAERSACGACHVTDEPTAADHALRHCQRKVDHDPDEGPATVVLKELANRYKPVTFAHKLHAKMAGMGDGCASCHHHDEDGRIQACKACHAPDGQSEDLRKPGLKGAYHRQCVACHREWSHSDACGFCHLRANGDSGASPAAADRSDIVGVPHPVVEAKATRVYKTTYEDGPLVTFRHQEHVDRFDLKCVDCHKKETCSRCHATGNEAPTPAPKRAHHDPCVRCHAPQIEESCKTCHDKVEKPSFRHAWPLGDRHKDLACRSCHPKGKPIAKLDPSCNSCHKDFRHDWPLKSYHARLACSACHPGGRQPAKVGRACARCHTGWKDHKAFDHARTGQALDATHVENASCADCHAGRRFDRPPTCKGCHEDKSFPRDRPGPQATGPGHRRPKSDPISDGQGG
jgi:hypothetical protein